MNLNKWTLIFSIILCISLITAFLIFNTSIDKEIDDQTDIVSSFEDCIKAGNPAMESYPRQCRHENQTYTEIVNDSKNLIEKSCQISDECPLPGEYAIQSNCPYATFCKDNLCVVGCPLWDQTSTSYESKCATNNECDCSIWDQQNQFPCECLDEKCVSVVESKK
ncbi:hypothetical protein ACFL21_05105 [Patescibacteria group bacterium]